MPIDETVAAPGVTLEVPNASVEDIPVGFIAVTTVMDTLPRVSVDLIPYGDTVRVVAITPRDSPDVIPVGLTIFVTEGAPNCSAGGMDTGLTKDGPTETIGGPKSSAVGIP